MFRSRSSDHHQGSITVLVQLLLISVHASSYSGMWLYVVCAYDVPVRVVSGYVLIRVHNQTPHGQVHRIHRHTDNIPEYDKARTLISSNCTSTVIDP